MTTEVSLKNTMLFLRNNGYDFKKILDIGCHFGNWTAEMKQLFPKAEYFLIDASDYPQRDKTIPFLNTVLSDNVGTVDWYDITSGNGTGNSYLRETTSHYKDTEPIKRPCTTLDTLFEEGRLHNDFDFIKLDVQGAEIDILKGASKFFEKAEMILLEVPFVGETNKNAPKFLDYIIFMDHSGFACYDIIELHRHYGMLLQVDILFVKKTSELLEKVQNTIHLFGTNLI